MKLKCNYYILFNGSPTINSMPPKTTLNLKFVHKSSCMENVKKATHIKSLS